MAAIGPDTSGDVPSRLLEYRGLFYFSKGLVAMPRNNSKKGNAEQDWKDRFVFVGLSVADEREAKEWVGGDGMLLPHEFIEELVDNGGSFKIKLNKSDGSAFVTIAVDERDETYGRYFFGLSYSNISGAMTLAQWFWRTMLCSDRGQKYLPSSGDDWLYDS